MEPTMQWSISHFEEALHYCTCVGSTRHWEAIWFVLWCIQYGYWRSTNARWSCNCLCLVIASAPWRALPHPWPRALGCRSCIESLEALSVRQSSAYLHGSQEPEVSFHSIWLEHEAMKVARTNQRLWVESPLSSWKGECGGRRPKPQTLMQPSHSPALLFLLWFWRTKSVSCSTWQIEQHSSYSNLQRRRHHRLKNGRWNGPSSPKIKVGRSSMLPTRCWWSSMVQGPSRGSKGFWALPQDHGWGLLLMVFYPSGNQQDVSRFEEEFLVDKDEARDSNVCVPMRHLSTSQDRSFETRQKPTTLEQSLVEMGKHLYGLHRGFASHLAWV
jgi:hypothetical protein